MRLWARFRQAAFLRQHCCHLFNFIIYNMGYASYIVRMTKPNQAKAWRIKSGLSVQQLADLSGYSPEAIYQFERGIRSDGEKQSAWAWQRYKLCCAAIES